VKPWWPNCESVVKRAARLLACALACAAIAGCGSSSHPHQDPAALLDAAAAHPIRSAQTDTDLRLTVAGVSALSSPVRLRLQGPYERGAGGQLPRFDWHLGASALGFPVGGRLVSTGTNVFLTVYGDGYQVGTVAAAAAGERLAGVAIHPRDWFGTPRDIGDGNEGGVDCERISAPLRGEAVARDLAPAVAALGLSSPPTIQGVAKACIGFDDHVLHELDVDALIAVPAAERAAVGGASGAHLQLDLTASDVGEPQRIAAPRGSYRPIRDLLLTLEDLGVPIP
jgi:hypothetical protein